MDKNISISKDNLSIVLLCFYLFVFLSGGLLSINLTLLSICTVAVFYLLKINGNSIKTYDFNNGQILIICFLLYALITVSWSLAPNYGFRKIYLTIIIVVILSLFRRLIILNPTKFLTVYSLFSTIFLIVFFLINGLAIFDLSTIYSRFNLTGDQNPIVVAYFLCFGALTLLYAFLDKKIPFYLRCVFLSVAFASMSLIVLTGSKGPIVALVLSPIISYVLYSKISLRSFVNVILAVFGIYIIVFFAITIIDFSPVFLEYIDARFSGDNENSSSFSSRLELYNMAFNRIGKSDFFEILMGQGSGSAGYLYTKKDDMMYPHNIFLEVFFEYGLIGFSLFVTMVIRVIYINIKAVDSVQFYAAMFYFGLIVALFSKDMMGNCLIFASYIYIEECYNLKWKR